MRFMILMPADAESEAGVMPTAELIAAMGKFNEELVKAGVLLAAEGLHPTSKGARIHFNGSQRKVVDGPFTESKELIAGFWLIQVKSKEEALQWVKRIPDPPAGKEGFVELRQVFDAEDFGPELAGALPEVFEAERKFREGEDARREERMKSANS